MALNIVVIYGSVRTKRQGIKGARFVVNQLEARGHEVTFIDPEVYDLPLLEMMYKVYDEGEAPETLETLATIYRNADAFVFVSGEYNHGIPPALKNLIDHFMNVYFWRPAAIASYSGGPFGGVRAAVHLRSVLAEVGLITIPSAFAMSKVGKSFDEEGNAQDKAYERRIQRFLDELEWYAHALKEARKGGVPYE